MLRRRHGGAKVSSQVGVLFALDGLGPPLAEDVAVVHLLSEAFGPMDPFVCQTFDRFQCKEWSLQETGRCMRRISADDLAICKFGLKVGRGPTAPSLSVTC